MELTASFVDENGVPIALGPWPGGNEVIPTRIDPHRFMYNHAYISGRGHSLARSDSVGHLKKVIVEVTPYLKPGLAVGRVINQVSFGGVELDESENLTQEVTVSGGKLKKGSGSEYEVELVAEVSIALLDRREVSLIFDEFPMDSIKVKDIKEVIAEGIGKAMDDVYMVRVYPTLRPVMFHDEQLMMGFHGKKSKGLWEERPYPGPIQPASIPTPPAMKFKLVDPQVYEFLEEEEEWWTQIQMQPSWKGDVEGALGLQTPIVMTLKPPHPAQFFKVTHANKAVIVNSRLIAPVKLNGVEVASPDKSYIKGFCKFKKSVRVEKLSKEMFGDELYLPGPELLANEGKEYTGYQKGVSFGEGVIEDSVLDPKTGALIHKKYNVTYKLVVVDGAKPRKVRLTLVTEYDSNYPTDAGTIGLEQVWEGELYKGPSQVMAFKGETWTLPEFAEDSDHNKAVRTPFCLFQCTIGGTVPDVVSSALGVRHADIHPRCLRIFQAPTHSKEPPKHISKAQHDHMAVAEFVGLISSGTDAEGQAQLIFAEVVTGAAGDDPTRGAGTVTPVMILWGSGVNHSKLKMSNHAFKHIYDSWAIVLSAETEADLHAEVAKHAALPGNTLLRIGKPVGKKSLVPARPSIASPAKKTPSTSAGGGGGGGGGGQASSLGNRGEEGSGGGGSSSRGGGGGVDGDGGDGSAAAPAPVLSAKDAKAAAKLAAKKAKADEKERKKKEKEKGKKKK